MVALSPRSAVDNGGQALAMVISAPVRLRPRAFAMSNANLWLPAYFLLGRIGVCGKRHGSVWIEPA